MTITTQDSRVSEADLEFRTWVQRGAPPRVVAELLAMLVGPVATNRAASRWLSTHAIVGNDLSDEGQAASKYLIHQARQVHNSALNSGMFAGAGQVFVPPPGRYAPSEAQTHAELDRQGLPGGYPGADENAARLRLSGHTEQMKRKHGSTASIDADTGDVYVTSPTTLRRHKVDHVNLSVGTAGDVDLSTSSAKAAADAANDAYWRNGEGGAVPFWVED